MDVEALRTRVDHDFSFGGLPGKGPPDALRAAYEVIQAGAEFHIKSDIEDFFSKIPRPRALRELGPYLPDDSLEKFLDEATRVEYENEEELQRRHVLDRFPDDALGVPQGHSLSGFLGNFLLRPVDDALNAGECTTLRYLDDFLILGPDEQAVYATFAQARELLNDYKMDAYEPGASEKASSGPSRQAFDFLGCQISDGFILPSRENRRRLKRRVREKLEASQRAMMGGAFALPESKTLSLSATLHEISRSLHAWAEQFKFCNAETVIRQLDKDIDDMLAPYIGVYADRKDRVSADRRRRMLGVALLEDVETNPILPL